MYDLIVIGAGAAGLMAAATAARAGKQVLLMEKMEKETTSPTTEKMTLHITIGWLITILYNLLSRFAMPKGMIY